MADQPEAVAECHGVKVPQSPMLNPTRIDRINNARYEGQEIAGALTLVRPGDRVLEMGTGIGLVGAIVAKKCNPAKVVSFEANANLIPHINALYQLNGLDSKVEVRNQVLLSRKDAPNTVAFHIQKSYLGSSLINDEKRRSEQVSVPTASFSKLRKDFGPTVLLMDIEGGELDFLRHASLEGFRAIVIEFHPEVYGKEGMRECKAILERAGFVKQPAHCSGRVWACTLGQQILPPTPEDGWSCEIETLEKAIVAPPPEPYFVQEAGVLRADRRYHRAGALWRNRRALTISPAPATGDAPTKLEGTWLWGGVLWQHFGHFLVESTSRLWALDALEQKVDGILFVPKRPRNGDEILSFQKDFVSLLGHEIPLKIATTSTEVEQLIVPGQGFGLGNMITGTAQFRAAISKSFAKKVQPKGSKKLYISRSQLPGGRGSLIGETEVEMYLESEGYTIYHPQKHDITSQVSTYKAADQIIAAEGSALHLLAMVARPEQKVAMIVRRLSGATRNLELHLEAFSGTPPVTMMHLSKSWKPRGKAKQRQWMGELDMPALQNALIEAGFIKSSTLIWKALDPADVKSVLGDNFVEVA